MIDLFTYTFMTRALIAGLIIGTVAPVIGLFLVLRRYSLVADVVAHVSLAGIAIGFATGLHPLLTSVIVTLGVSTVIDKLRSSKKLFGESALALFLSGSLAVAVVLISISHGMRADIFSYLFGSILTVTIPDILLIGLIGGMVLISIICIWKELVAVTFDEELAQTDGIPVAKINTLFILLSALSIVVAIPVIGALLISALIVIPALSALQWKKGFTITSVIGILYAQSAVIVGILLSYILNIPTGATIVLTALSLFALTYTIKR